MNLSIRREQPDDVDAIARLTERAFRSAEHSSHTEQFIVDALRRSGQLTLSLVALEGDVMVGHVAVSPVAISSGVHGWCGLGPISVLPERQNLGVGSALMMAALDELRRLEAAGCVLLGEPAYYSRFGFKPYAGLQLPGVPPEYFQAVALRGEIPQGSVSYHASFEATR